MGSCPELRAPAGKLRPGIFTCAPGEAPQLHTLGTFMEASSRRQGQSLAQFPAPLPSLRMWVGLKLQVSNPGLVFLLTSPRPGALVRTKEIPASPGKFKALMSWCCEPELKTKY